MNKPLTMWERGQLWLAQYKKDRAIEKKIVEGHKVSEKAIRKSKHLAAFRMKMKKKQQRDKDRKIREDRMVYMRVHGRMTLDQISKVEGITRERVRQILNVIGARDHVSIPKHVRPPRLDNIVTKCAYKTGCETLIVRRPHQFKGHGKHYCSDHARFAKDGKWAKINPDWHKMTDRQQAKWKYDHSLEFRKKLRESQHRWLAKVKKDPVRYSRYLKMQRACTDRWQAKQRQKA